MQSSYVCPVTKKPLREEGEGLLRDDGVLYPFLPAGDQVRIPNFLVARDRGERAQQSLAEYDRSASAEIYRNSLNWLFQTFGEDEASFRAALIAKLKVRRGDRVLITGCGLGDDIGPMLDAVGPDGEVYASDLAAEMVLTAAGIVTSGGLDQKGRTCLSVCDAHSLPFPDDFFDRAFHFGGINLFDDIRLAVDEMQRVVKPGGRIVFGDEGIGPWLRSSEYGRMAINNNSLWGTAPPIDVLPRNAVDVHLTWVLGNCFYVIDFEVSDAGPFMNIDVPHKGPRGGSMRTRYFGRLEGVTEEAKKFVLDDAARQGISVHDWLEQVIRDQRNR